MMSVQGFMANLNSYPRKQRQQLLFMKIFVFLLLTIPPIGFLFFYIYQVDSFWYLFLGFVWFLFFITFSGHLFYWPRPFTPRQYEAYFETEFPCNKKEYITSLKNNKLFTHNEKAYLFKRTGGYNIDPYDPNLLSRLEKTYDSNTAVAHLDHNHNDDQITTSSHENRILSDHFHDSYSNNHISESLNTHTVQDINPVSGVPMFGGTDSVGNAYGTDTNSFDYASSSIDHSSNSIDHSSSIDYSSSTTDHSSSFDPNNPYNY